MGNKEMEVAKAAKRRFDMYAAIDGTDLPCNMFHDVNLAALQVRLVRWQTKNFGGATLAEVGLGASEEVGELCHAILKSMQGIRGYSDKDKLRADAGDAIADATVYLIQCATILRLDFAALLFGTASNVMARDWKADAEMGGEQIVAPSGTASPPRLQFTSTTEVYNPSHKPIVVTVGGARHRMFPVCTGTATRENPNPNAQEIIGDCELADGHSDGCYVSPVDGDDQ